MLFIHLKFTSNLSAFFPNRIQFQINPDNNSSPNLFQSGAGGGMACEPMSRDRLGGGAAERLLGA